MKGVVNVESGTLRLETLSRKWLGGNELASTTEVTDPPL